MVRLSAVAMSLSICENKSDEVTQRRHVGDGQTIVLLAVFSISTSVPVTPWYQYVMYTAKALSEIKVPVPGAPAYKELELPAFFFFTFK